jgi:hypothetical protein
MERAAGFTRDDTLQAKLDKFDVLLAQSSTSAQDAALFAEMLSLPNTDAIRRSNLRRNSAGKKCSTRSFHRSRPCRVKIRC